MRLNFTANSFVFGGKNSENAPKTFYIARKAKTSKMRLNFTSIKQLNFWTQKS